MPQGGDLTLTAANRTLDAAEAAQIPDARPGDFFTVEVRDTGTGIPAAGARADLGAVLHDQGRGQGHRVSAFPRYAEFCSSMVAS